MSEVLAGRAQGEPPSDPRELRGFPCRDYLKGSTVFRVHLARNGPWFFSNSKQGRFNLVGTKRGTCYLAIDPITAILEVLNHERGMVCTSFFEPRRLSELQLPRAVRAADTRDRRAGVAFQLTRELSSEVSYDRPQRWAFAFDASRYVTGIGGISYWPRHDLDSEAESLALFGKEGERRSRDWKKGLAHEFDDGWFVRMEREAGVVVQPPPDDSDLSIE